MKFFNFRNKKQDQKNEIRQSDDLILKSFLSEEPRFLQGKNLSLNVKNIPVPTRKTSITGPQTKSFTLVTISVNLSI